MHLEVERVYTLAHLAQPTKRVVRMTTFTPKIWHFLAFILSSTSIQAKRPEQTLKDLAQDYYELTIEIAQPYGYFNDFELPSHDKFIKNSPESLKHYRDTEDRIYEQLNKLKVENLEHNKAKIFYAKFVESLESSIDERVCKSELWNISHMFGAHTLLDFLVTVQPIKTPQNKLDTLKRWSEISSYYQQEIKNLNMGLAQGYSAPKRVVKRLISQLEKLTDFEINQHPFLELVKTSQDERFNHQFKELLKEDLIPSLKAFTAYLQNTYLTTARTALGLHAIPNGRACYIALYRRHTTLKRTPEKIFDIGYAEVDKNITSVITLGKELYGTSTFAEAVAKANQDKSQTFASSEQMHTYYLEVVKRSKSAMEGYFFNLPSIGLDVKAIPEYQQGSGRSAHYSQGSNQRSARFYYDPSTFPLENFGTGEIVTVHEGYPGHHMQVALVQDLEPFHAVESLFENSAFSEGWARYAESLAEEAGIYHSKSAKILRRTWPARGMVADTAMHLLGWSNQAVTKILSDSGKPFSKFPDVMMDRMAAMPAQLTAYDSGALEIFALRKEVKQALGDKFDIKQFHHLILKNGNVPLAVLRQEVMKSIDE
ncbi:MAG: hypothetical protein COA74_08825 [Gammaproteobacteria bacterium]|nr:MAG: hypothetical protein COA74_08825 [Gammaproteobacteria bacterium]